MDTPPPLALPAPAIADSAQAATPTGAFPKDSPGKVPLEADTKVE